VCWEQLAEKGAWVLCRLAVASKPEDISTDNAKEYLQKLGQALVCFGEALAAALPSKACCNHTGCTNLGRLSEAELVGGKACVCGRWAGVCIQGSFLALS
jgi:hypothetical protein